MMTRGVTGRFGRSWMRTTQQICAVFVALAVLSTCATAGQIESKGYVEGSVRLFPQLTPTDRAYAIEDALLRWEPSLKLGGGFTLFGSVDVRTDSHHQAQRELAFSWFDRTLQRPMLSVRRASLLYRRDWLTVEAGKQFVRWGKTDILNPTDRFAPKDYLTVVETDYLPVTAARVTLEKKSNTLDLVYVPRFTPARIPLFNQRWVMLPTNVQAAQVRDTGATFPGGPQFGVRFDRIAARLEYSLSFYQGYHQLPVLTPSFDPATQLVNVHRTYPTLRAYGADAAVPLPWFTLKAETSMLTSETPGADDYLLYVAQVERQWKEWIFVGGYAGEVVTERGQALQFPADRGLARALVARASVNLTSNRTLTFETVARQNGDGFYARAEYSHGLGQHWRVSAMFVGIRGSLTDYLGQYRRNSFGGVTTRYSF